MRESSILTFKQGVNKMSKQSEGIEIGFFGQKFLALGSRVKFFFRYSDLEFELSWISLFVMEIIVNK